MTIAVICHMTLKNNLGAYVKFFLGPNELKNQLIFVCIFRGVQVAPPVPNYEMADPQNLTL